MTAKDPLGSNAPSALRAQRLVEAMEFETSADFARWLQIDPRRWNNFERGYPFSRDIARILMQAIPGLSYEWIFDGRPDGLSVEMARKLGEFPEVPRSQPPRAKAKVSRR